MDEVQAALERLTRMNTRTQTQRELDAATIRKALEERDKTIERGRSTVAGLDENLAQAMTSRLNLMSALREAQARIEELEAALEERELQARENRARETRYLARIEELEAALRQASSDEGISEPGFETGAYRETP